MPSLMESSTRVQEKLLDQGQNLTLTKALEIGRQFEMSQQQMKVMRGEEIAKTYSVREQQKIQGKRIGNQESLQPIHQTRKNVKDVD